MSSSRRVRIGIDVGGTFTHAVALDAETLTLVGKAKIPTTHDAGEGVARGVVDSLKQLLEQCGIKPAQVVLVAHSTTQATNALLEGDVASVGIIGMGGGASTWIARKQTAIKPIQLTPRRFLKTFHCFIPSIRVNRASVDAALDTLRRAGAEVIVAAEAFSVDDPGHEQFVCDLAAERGLPATATHHISRLHGLRIRTRTTVINAGMIPKMLRTAEMTEHAVRVAGIRAPLMIMRSDGGVMSISEMRRRPILTMLSGPAAGVAAALLYARVSDGLFLEVGGTSTDISVIKNGRCRTRSAEVGGQKLHVSTLDVRTVGLAGGSLAFLDHDRLSQVGPRSCHIAGYPYLSFTKRAADSIRCTTVEHEGEAFLAVVAGDEHLAVTPTCASNRLGLIPPGDPAAGNQPAIERGLDLLAQPLGLSDGAQVARAIMQSVSSGVSTLLHDLIQDYKLDPNVISLIGGGGGASAIVPYVAQTMNLPHLTVENADVVSAIGVALALVRDSVEITAIDPSEEDIRRIRADAFAGVLRMGAAPETIQVYVEVDAKQNLLRATAEGATEICQQQLRTAASSSQDRQKLVAASMGTGDIPPEQICTAAGFEIWMATRLVHRLWKFMPESRRAIRVLDRAGSIRWASSRADVRQSTVGSADRDLAQLAETYTVYSDAGATIPRCYVLLADRIIDFSGLIEINQVLEVARIEMKSHTPDTQCVLLVDRD